MEVLFKGMMVGVTVAAPVGPIGLLCIKQTLGQGRLHGAVAGLGAASADALYGMVVAVGFCAATQLLPYSDVLTAVGGGLMLLMGLMMLRSGQSSQADRMGSEAGQSLENRPLENRLIPSGVQLSHVAAKPQSKLPFAFFSTFSLTMTNPMTLVAFMGLVAGLSGGNSANGPFVLVLGVFMGSVFWWLGLVMLSATLNNQLSNAARRSVFKWLDRLAGLVLLLWGLGLLASAL